ncbi:MAG: Lrp/AsnC family transcriptional regulator [Pseudomonadota bacterium]
MDEIDRRIVRALETDGRIRNTELAKTVGLSPSACLRRVSDLERRGVIAGYRAVIDPKARGIGFIAYVAVGLSDHSKRAQTAFEESISRAGEVRECHNITGSVEYLLRVETRDLEDYKRFHLNVLGTIEHVTAITSYIVMASPKDARR